MARKTSKDKASKHKASKGGDALTHIDASGEARMVDVSAKAATERTAVAEGRVVMGKATLELIVAARDKASKDFGVNSTPTFFINGKRLKGRTDTLESFDQAIAPLLNG